MTKPTVKARLVNMAWRAFRPGSRGQKFAQALVYSLIIVAIVLLASIRF